MSESREALRIAVIGAGIGGIAAAIQLRAMGINDIAVFEKAADLGGTWRENTYPGLTCDVPSHLYRFSFAPNPDWSHRYSPGAEIQAYIKRVVADFNVEPLIRFSSEVTSAVWRDGKWRLETTQGDQGEFDVVISAVGVLHHPVYPAIAGLADFRGPMFHSARWDHDVSLKDKRVGIVGTGSTAIQILPAIIDEAAKVSLFQRTAQWIMPQPNPSTSAEKKAAYRVDPELMSAQYEYLKGAFNGAFCAAVAGENPTVYDEISQACRDNLDTIEDPHLRAKLTPNFKVGCKRLIISELFYPAIQRPDADLVTEDIVRVEAKGIATADGRLHELDVLVLATGFDPHHPLGKTTVVGQTGQSLDALWSDGNIAYRGVTVPDFPNWFMLGGPNSPIGNFSYIMTAERQLGYVLQLVQLLQAGRARAIAPRWEATRSYNAELKAKMSSSIWASGCRSWYIDKTGAVASYPWAYETFERDMSQPVLVDFVIA